MFGALRMISVQQGYDPRGFALMGFGGAGPLHGHSRWPDFPNVPNEFLERDFPLRIERYETVPDSGGAGLHRGGNRRSACAIAGRHRPCRADPARMGAVGDRCRMSDRAALTEDYAKAGFDGHLPFGQRPAVLLVDVCRAYLDPASPLYAGVEGALAANERLVAAARAADVSTCRPNMPR